MESSLERTVDDIKRDVENEDLEVEKISTSFENRSLRIRLVDNVDAPPIEKILLNFPFLEKQEATDDGMMLNYHLSTAQEEQIKKNAVTQALETIRNRVDEFGVAEPVIQAQGERRILVQLPGIKDTERAMRLIGETALLEFKLVDEENRVEDALQGNIPLESEILYQKVDKSQPQTPDSDPRAYLVKSRTVLAGDTLTGAEVRFDSEYNEPYVAISFNRLGANIFRQVTKENIQKRMAIVLDNKVYSAPTIQK